MTDSVDGVDPGTPVWAVFGDLMAGLLGAFVLILVGALAMQFDLSERLKTEVQQRQAESQRLVEALERALAIPLGGRPRDAGGRAHRHQRQRAVRVQLRRAAARRPAVAQKPVRARSPPTSAARDEALMVSGFTDDRQVRDDGARARFADNWELSAQRALTVMRALIEDGVPSARRCSPPRSARSSRWHRTPMQPAVR